MRFNVRAFMLTAAVLWAVGFFLVGIANLIWTGYGSALLAIMASIYPGYDAAGSFGEVIVGTLYALVDGAVGGLVFSWFYNLLADRIER